MDKLLIIADDFTGALDTGIQFTKMEVRAKIITDYQYDFQNLKEEYRLLVVNTDTRPLSPQRSVSESLPPCGKCQKSRIRVCI